VTDDLPLVACHQGHHRIAGVPQGLDQVGFRYPAEGGGDHLPHGRRVFGRFVANYHGRA
jgi:hypothetical protein